MTLAARYTLLKLLGDGSFGSVYMAECKATRETVCTSAILRRPSPNAGRRQENEREIQFLGRLH